MRFGIFVVLLQQYGNVLWQDRKMRLTYIFHSGFALETEDCILIFDWWMDPEYVMRGILQSAKPLYVFSSHFHEDHFNPRIFQWRKVKENITYILSKDILKHRRAEKENADVWLAKGGYWEDGLIRVVATGSTDSGVSWIVDVGGKRVFHAGDLNNWYARYLNEEFGGRKVFSSEAGAIVDPYREEKRYLGELKDIRKVADGFDVAMFPVDGRIGNGYTRGARQFLEHFKVGLLVPMHFVACGFESAWRMEEFTAPGQLWKIRRNGESKELE
jgi:L-ascorbate metabolism protein UlaG (beta-lactamase superfamily)